jgi:hypothetical protein
VRYSNALAKFEQKRRQMRVYFGNDARVSEVLAEIDAEVTARETRAKRSKARMYLLWAALIILPFLSLGLTFSSIRSDQSTGDLEETCRKCAGKDDCVVEAVAACGKLCEGGTNWSCELAQIARERAKRTQSPSSGQPSTNTKVETH